MSASVLSDGIIVSVYARTDVGRRRQGNEDSFLVGDLSTGRLGLGPEVTCHKLGPQGTLMMVSDGLGGAAAGEVASAMAVQTVCSELMKSTKSVLSASERLKRATEQANDQIWNCAQSDNSLRGMGATLTAAFIYGKVVYIAQVGDSRAYIIRGGKVKQVTEDQSWANAAKKAGLDFGEIPNNVILQALGTQPKVHVEVTSVDICHGDAILLCSDGLSNKIKEPEIPDTVTTHIEDLPEACKIFVDLANKRGGEDNITVVIAHFMGENIKIKESNLSITSTFKVITPLAFDDNDTEGEETISFRANVPDKIDAFEMTQTSISDNIPTLPEIPRLAEPATANVIKEAKTQPLVVPQNAPDDLFERTGNFGSLATTGSKEPEAPQKEIFERTGGFGSLAEMGNSAAAKPSATTSPLGDISKKEEESKTKERKARQMADTKMDMPVIPVFDPNKDVVTETKAPPTPEVKIEFNPQPVVDPKVFASSVLPEPGKKPEGTPPPTRLDNMSRLEQILPLPDVDSVEEPVNAKAVPPIFAPPPPKPELPKSASAKLEAPKPLVPVTPPPSQSNNLFAALPKPVPPSTIPKLTGPISESNKPKSGILPPPPVGVSRLNKDDEAEATLALWPTVSESKPVIASKSVSEIPAPAKVEKPPVPVAPPPMPSPIPPPAPASKLAPPIIETKPSAPLPPANLFSPPPKPVAPTTPIGPLVEKESKPTPPAPKPSAPKPPSLVAPPPPASSKFKTSNTPPVAAETAPMPKEAPAVSTSNLFAPPPKAPVKVTDAKGNEFSLESSLFAPAFPSPVAPPVAPPKPATEDSFASSLPGLIIPESFKEKASPKETTTNVDDALEPIMLETLSVAAPPEEEDLFPKPIPKPASSPKANVAPPALTKPLPPKVEAKVPPPMSAPAPSADKTGVAALASLFAPPTGAAKPEPARPEPIKPETKANIKPAPPALVLPPSMPKKADPLPAPAPASLKPPPLVAPALVTPPKMESSTPNASAPAPDKGGVKWSGKPSSVEAQPLSKDAPNTSSLFSPPAQAAKPAPPVVSAPTLPSVPPPAPSASVKMAPPQLPPKLDLPPAPKVPPPITATTPPAPVKPAPPVQQAPKPEPPKVEAKAPEVEKPKEVAKSEVREQEKLEKLEKTIKNSGNKTDSSATRGATTAFAGSSRTVKTDSKLNPKLMLGLGAVVVVVIIAVGIMFSMGGGKSGEVTTNSSPTPVITPTPEATETPVVEATQKPVKSNTPAPGVEPEGPVPADTPGRVKYALDSINLTMTRVQKELVGNNPVRDSNLKRLGGFKEQLSSFAAKNIATQEARDYADAAISQAKGIREQLNNLPKKPGKQK